LRQIKIEGKFWFTTQTARPSFGSDSDFTTPLVSHDPSRKQFFAKLLGLTAVAGLAPKLLAGSSSKAAPAPAPVTSGSIQLRPEARAVARRVDSV